MTNSTYVALTLAGLFPAGMICAGFSDLLTMRIPNVIVIVLCAAFVVATPLASWSIEAIGIHLLVGFAVLMGMVTLFAFNLVGGGDAKLAAVSALWLGPDHILAFLGTAACLGGALALLFFGFRAVPLPAWFAARAWIARIHAPGSGIPYGVALSLAAVLVFPAIQWPVT